MADRYIDKELFFKNQPAKLMKFLNTFFKEFLFFSLLSTE